MDLKNFDPTVAGSLDSFETTPIQDQLISIIGYYAKIAKIVSDTEAVYVIEQPKGLENYLKAKEILEKAQEKPLSRDQIEKLEKQHRFAERHKPLGNSTSIINHLLGDVLSDDKVREIIKNSTKEAREIAGKVSLIKKQLKTVHKGEEI